MILKNTKRKMPKVPAHLRELTLGMLQGGRTPAQDRYIRTSHLRDMYRMATTPAQVTPGMHNPSISAQTVRNWLREAGLRACRPVVRQVLTRHQHHLWAQTPSLDQTGLAKIALH